LAGWFGRTVGEARRFIAWRREQRRKREANARWAFRSRTRREIVIALAQRPYRPLSARELGRSLPTGQANIAYHLRVLAELGAVWLVAKKPAPSGAGSEALYKLDARWLRTREVRSALRRRTWRRGWQRVAGMEGRCLES